MYRYFNSFIEKVLSLKNRINKTNQFGIVIEICWLEVCNILPLKLKEDDERIFL